MTKRKKKFIILMSAFISICMLVLVSQVYLSAAEKLSKNESSNSNVSGNNKKVEYDNTEYKPYKIRVVDKNTKRGVPMIELKGTNAAMYYTDSNGYISFYDPGLMGEEVWFTISGHGYKYTKESFSGFGEAINIRPDILESFGIEKVLYVNRENIAERLYRITGQGIYGYSRALNLETPIKNPVLNAKVMKQGPVQTIVYKNMIYWFWENTMLTTSTRPNNITGAISKKPEDGGLDPSQGIDLDYFKEKDGFAKELLPNLPNNASSISINGLMTVPDKTGQLKLLAGYAAYTKTGELLGRGILIFDDDKKEFNILKEFDINNKWQYPRGNAVLYEDNGKEYWLFSDPYANVRVMNDFDSITDQSKYEAFTPIKSGKGYSGANTDLDLDSNNKPIWTWKTDAPPLTQQDERNLIKISKIKYTDAYHQLMDDSGITIELTSASIGWNEYRKKWVMIGQQIINGLASGDIWYSEADAPVGPWGRAKKIISHVDYGFNNPVLHPYFNQEGGRYIYFEGNLSNKGYKTKAIAQYNDNQIMYRLDLSDERLGLTVAP